MRVWIAVIVAVAAAVSGHAAGEAEAAAPGQLVITWHGVNPTGNPVQEGSIIEQAIEAQFPDVDLKPVPIDWSDQDQIALRIAAGDVPDFAYDIRRGMAGTSLRQLAEDGVIRSVPREWLTTHMPTYVRYVDTNDTGKAWPSTQVDGVQYAIPNVSAGNATGHILGVRDDWAQAVGFEAPDSWTLADFEDLIRRLRNEDPDGNGNQDQYGYARWAQQGMGSLSVASASFPNVFGAHGVRIATWDQNGDWSMISDGYREALKQLAAWWEDDLIDPESFTVDRATWTAKWANHRLGVVERNWTWLRQRAGSPINEIRKTMPEVSIIYLPQPQGPAGAQTSAYGAATAVGLFGKDASDDKVVKIMQILEWVESDPDRHWRSRVGPLGLFDPEIKYAERVSPTELRRIGEFQNNEAYAKAGMYKFAMHNYRPIELWRTNIAGEVSTVVEAGVAATLVDEGPWVEFSADVSKLRADLSDIEVQFYVKAIAGQVDIDADWDAYVKSWMANGGARMTDAAKQFIRDGTIME